MTTQSLLLIIRAGLHHGSLIPVFIKIGNPFEEKTKCTTAENQMGTEVSLFPKVAYERTRYQRKGKTHFKLLLGEIALNNYPSLRMNTFKRVLREKICKILQYLCVISLAQNQNNAFKVVSCSMRPWQLYQIHY